MKCEIAFFLAAVSVAAAQFFEPFGGQTLPLAIQPPPFQRASFQPSFQGPNPVKRVTPHRAVVVNAENEARLPAELKKFDFYANPRTAQALAKESWFTNEEEQVFNREADKIPRGQVAKLLRQAGLIRRR